MASGHPAGPGGVACDVCIGTKLRAVKSCLVCLVSYCQEHLQPHYQAAAFQTHRLVEPCKDLRNICFTHGELKTIFCRTDHQSICQRCTMDQHRGHDSVPAAAEREQKQKDVEEGRKNIPLRIKEREEEVKLLQQQQDNINHSADEAVELSQKVFNQLISRLQERSDEVTQHLRSQQEGAVSGFRELQEKLEQEVEQFKWIYFQLEQLLHTEDHNHFLQGYTSLAALCPSTHSSVIETPPRNYFEGVTAALFEGADKLQETLRDTWTNIPEPSQPEPKTKAELLRYSTTITLDPNTVNGFLVLSEGNRKVTTIHECTNYSHHPDRFTSCCQVLSRESLTGRCYWEVEWKLAETGVILIGDVTVAVAYTSISREDDLFSSLFSKESDFGFNDKSWALKCNQYSYEFIHDYIKTPVSGPLSSRLGVFLDQTAGILSFYSVSETLTLLHRVQTSFTQPLHLGLRLSSPGVSAEIVRVF